jgi:hypothetical protein
MTLPTFQISHQINSMDFINMMLALDGDGKDGWRGTQVLRFSS